MNTTQRSSWSGYREIVCHEYPEAVLLVAVPWMDILSMWWREEKTLMDLMWQAITIRATTMQKSHIVRLGRYIIGTSWPLTTVGRLMFVKQQNLTDHKTCFGACLVYSWTWSNRTAKPHFTDYTDFIQIIVNPSMDKWLHSLWCVGWNGLFIIKLERLHRWSLEMGK